MLSLLTRLAGAIPRVYLKGLGAPIQCPMPILYADITTNCNSLCKTCAYRSYGESTNLDELSAKEWRQVLDDARKLGCVLVSFGGGEPFVRSDFPEILSDAASFRFSIHLNTNGILLDREKIQFLHEIGVSAVTISLDANSAELYRKIRGVKAFEKTTQAIRLLKEIAPDIFVPVECTITRLNVHRLESIAQLAKDLGADQIKFTPAISNLQHQGLDDASDIILHPSDSDATAQALKIFVDGAGRDPFIGNSCAYLQGIPPYIQGRRPHHHCFAGILYGNIDPFGNVFPCYDLAADYNVRDRSLSAIWNDPGFDQLRRRVRQCDQVCWNVGNAEPSLLLNSGDYWLKLRQGFHELRHYRKRTRK